MSGGNNLLEMRIRWLRGMMIYAIIATAQLLCPAAAADPASKIDPPAWSYKHSQEEVQAYGIRAKGKEKDQTLVHRISQTRLRRIALEQGLRRRQ